MEKPFDHQQLNQLLHSRIRLAIMAILATVDEIGFNTMKQEVNTTDGNLSIHIKKLEDAGYVKVNKIFWNRKPRTTCSITKAGSNALDSYFNQLELLIKKKKN